MIDAWKLALMEEYGLMDTNEGLLNRIVKYLELSPNDTIEMEELSQACIACNVDPDSITPSDLDFIKKRLK